MENKQAVAVAVGVGAVGTAIFEQKLIK